MNNVAVKNSSVSLVVDNTKELTMSSLQISDYTGKKHKHILRDIRVMYKELGIPEESNFGLVEKINNLGFTVKEPVYYLNEELCMTLVTGYNISIRNRLVKEWQRLREENAELKTQLVNQEINPFANFEETDWIELALEEKRKNKNLIALHIRKSVDAHSMTRLLGEKKGSVRVQEALNALKEAGYITRRFNDAGKPCGYDLNESGYMFCRMSAHGQLEFTVDVLPVLVKLGVLAEEQKDTLKLPQPNNVKAIVDRSVKDIRSNTLSLVNFGI
ncbi:Rha family transcriptional regulator [Salmonella enterica subsp. enterica serovar Virchow]|nr:Rha family transcriptional regulator [Salmonella enterica subsp. enterica serovar Virchow]